MRRRQSPRQAVCGECGTLLGAGVPPLSGRKGEAGEVHATEIPPPESLSGERKTVTVLFADIEGSMELMEALDPEKAHAIVDPALKVMIDAVHRYDGYIVQSTSAGNFALFGAPVAHEDHPQTRAQLAVLPGIVQVTKPGESAKPSLRRGGRLT
jgi:class 3 adenylate cyclase